MGNENCSSLFHPNEREGGRKLVLDQIILEEGEGRGQEEREERDVLSIFSILNILKEIC